MAKVKIATNTSIQGLKKKMAEKLNPVGVSLRVKYVGGRYPTYWLSAWFQEGQIVEFFWKKGVALKDYEVTVCRKDGLFRLVEQSLNNQI